MEEQSLIPPIFDSENTGLELYYLLPSIFTYTLNKLVRGFYLYQWFNDLLKPDNPCLGLHVGHNSANCPICSPSESGPILALSRMSGIPSVK